MARLTPRNLLGAARIRVWKKHPYFTAALFNLKPVEVPGMQGIAVDSGMRMLYGPEFVAKYEAETVAAFLAHEVQHVVRCHERRMHSTEATLRPRYNRVADVLRERLGIESWNMLWNWGGDFEINDDIGLAGWKFPADHPVLMPQNHNLPTNQLAETYVRLLIERAEKEKKDEQDAAAAGQSKQGEKAGATTPSGRTGEDSLQPDDGEDETPPRDGEPENEDRVREADEDDPEDGEQGGEGEVGDGDSQGGPAGGDHAGESDDSSGHDDDAAGEGADHQGRDGAGSGSGDGPSRVVAVGGGSCGSCAGHRLAHEAEVTDDWPDASTEVEKEIMRRQVASAVLGHNGRGVTPSRYLLDWARSMFQPPKVDWRKLLAAQLRGAVAAARGRVDWRYGRPGRRYMAQKARGFGDDAPLMPELHGPEPKVVVVVDTSGSMGHGKRSRLAKAGGEVIGLMRHTGVTPHLITVDAAVFDSKPLKSVDQLLKMLGGGGGTDMRVGIKAAADRKLRADVCIVMTDCETPWPSHEEMPRDLRVIVLGVGHEHYFNTMPPYLKRHAIYAKEN